MSKKLVHFDTGKLVCGYTRMYTMLACGRMVEKGIANVTTDESKVTCKTCIRKVAQNK